MEIKKYGEDIQERICHVCSELEDILSDYSSDYATYGWDNFSETIANVSAQLYMMKMMIQNATIKNDKKPY